MIRGATAATSGSSKWPSSGPSHPSEGTQSESTNATSALCTRSIPALRAPDGPTFDANPTNRAPWRSATALVVPASADASSTTTHARPPSAPSSRSSCTGRSRTGTTTVTSSGPNVGATGRGTNAPADTMRRASSCVARFEPTGAPVRQRVVISRARADIRNRRRGLPPRSTVPPSKPRVDGSSISTNEPGSGVEARGGAGRSGAGRPGCAGVRHHAILAVRGRR